ncbi:MAG: type II toxin-antitoxin system prevent-host-death family antitoxin [Capsulimonas sp.]|uniref:type II toxin-antitoxin system Phd/YefM family antitoxin n=1 Tax=Capsulimonas sp. TaxID=2494211 RepID=UPI0032673BE0
MTIVVNSTDAKRNLGGLIDSARTDTVVIERFGRPVVVLVDYDRFQSLEKQATPPKRQLGAFKHIPLNIEEFMATPVPGMEEYE